MHYNERNSLPLTVHDAKAKIIKGIILDLFTPISPLPCSHISELIYILIFEAINLNNILSSLETIRRGQFYIVLVHILLPYFVFWIGCIQNIMFLKCTFSSDKQHGYFQHLIQICSFNLIINIHIKQFKKAYCRTDQNYCFSNSFK